MTISHADAGGVFHVAAPNTPVYDTNDTRVMKHVPPPLASRLTSEELFSGGTIDLKLLMHTFAREGKLTVDAAEILLKKALAILKSEENLIEIEAPVHVFGDIHGQLFDMFSWWEKAGPLEEVKQLWLGDYVDRGAFGCECALWLLANKGVFCSVVVSV